MHVVLVRNEDFAWTNGESSIQEWKKPNADWIASFCRICGSPVPGKNDDQQMYVPAGSIVEGGEALQVSDHIFVDSRANWDVISDDGRCHAAAYRVD